MEKEKVMRLLNACLLYLEGVNEEKLSSYFGEEATESGINLAKFLETKE